MWRLGAWVASAALFAFHIGYQHYRRAATTLGTALHAAMAVAVGALLLAIAATIHAATVPSHAPYSRYLLALVIWPIITALPAFLVALAAAWVLTHLPMKPLGR